MIPVENMNRARRIAKSEAARAKRKKLKDTLFECAPRKFNRLRKLRRLGKRDTSHSVNGLARQSKTVSQGSNPCADAKFYGSPWVVFNGNVIVVPVLSSSPHTGI